MLSVIEVAAPEPVNCVLKFVMHEYPSMTFRLTRGHLVRIKVIANAKHCSRGQVIRGAIDMYYRTVVRPVGEEGPSLQIVNPMDLLADLLPEQAGNDGIQFD